MLNSKDKTLQSLPTSPLSTQGLSFKFKKGSKNKSSFQELFSIEPQEPKDLACLVIHSLKSKTQVSSPKFFSLLNSGFNSQAPLELETFQFELYKKCSEEKIRKLEKDLDNKSKRLKILESKVEENFKKSTGKTFEVKMAKVLEMIEKLKEDKKGLYDLVVKSCSMVHMIKENLLEILKNNESCKFNRKISGVDGNERRSLSFNFLDKKTSFVFFNAQTSKLEEQIMSSLKDIQNFYKEKMKNEQAKYSQILAELKIDLLEKEEKIEKFGKIVENYEEKQKRLERQNFELNQEIDSLCIENSKIMKELLRLFKEQKNSEKKLESLSDFQSVLKKNEKNEKIQENRENLENLEKKNQELQRIIKKLTKNSGFTELQQENLELKNQLDILREKCSSKEKDLSSYTLKITQLENNIKTLNEFISKSKEKYFKLNSELKKMKDQEKNRSILYTRSEKLSNLADFPVNLSEFKSMLPKFDSLSKYLESILIFRKNLMKTFTFPDELLVFREVPLKFLEKSLYYFEVLKKVTKYFLSKEDSKDFHVAYIKDLELLIFHLKEQNESDRLKTQNFFIEQESLLLNEIESLQTSLNYSKALLRTMKPNKANLNGFSPVPSKSEQESLTALTDLTSQSSPGKSSLKAEKPSSLSETPSKSESFLESRVVELSLSVSKYKAKSKILKQEKKDLIEELKDLQFKEKTTSYI